MKLVITFNNEHVLFDVAECAPLVAALQTAKIVNEQGYGHDSQFIPTDEAIRLQIVDEARLQPKPEPLAKLQQERAAADSRWIECYNRATAAEKKLKEFEDKLKSKGIILADDTLEKEAQ